MKVIFALALVAYVVMVCSHESHENNDEGKGKFPVVWCPDENMENATIIGNPYNCNTYFVCESGEPIPMKCPKGLHFNAELAVCDYPRRAKCKEIKPPAAEAQEVEV